MTKLLGVIGDPIAHSMSPLIHNGWIRDMGIGAVYEALHVADGEFGKALKTIEKRDCLGVNVTLPHKQIAAATAREVSAATRAIGAANTLTYQAPGIWRADNTDAPGFMHAVGDIDKLSDRVLLLGAGGSARAIAYALSVHGVPWCVLNRTKEKAQHLARDFGNSGTDYAQLNEYKEYIDSATIVINTTSMGHGGSILDLPDGAGRIFFDISYGKVSAPQLDHARAQGWQTRDGLIMLVAQAAYSFEIWFGERPDMQAGLRRCRAALEAIS